MHPLDGFVPDHRHASIAQCGHFHCRIMVIYSIADTDTDDSIAPMGLLVQRTGIAIAPHKTEVGGSQLDCLGVDMLFRHCGGMVVGLQRQAVIDKGVPVVCRGEIDGAVVACRNIEVVGFQMQFYI